MVTLLLSSKFSTDSRLLRQAASRLGWNTLRVGGSQLPEEFDVEGTEAVIYADPLAGLEFARELGHVLLGAGGDWLASLDQDFLKREVCCSTLGDVRRQKKAAFVKPVVSKSFPAGVYRGDRLPTETAALPHDFAVYVAEPVTWETEFRAFILEEKVQTLSAYRYMSRALTTHEQALPVPTSVEAEAINFCEAVVRVVDCPPAFVLDVGMIRSRGWAVIEPNECWAAGIYTCDPTKVLEVLRRASVPVAQLTPADQKWDLETHFFRACPHLRDSV